MFQCHLMNKIICAIWVDRVEIYWIEKFQYFEKKKEKHLLKGIQIKKSNNYGKTTN